MKTQFSLFSSRRFLPLFVSQFFGALNDNLFKNALVMLITYYVSGNSQILVTAAAGIFILPYFLFSATAGQLADKYEKSSLIKIVKFFEIILMLLAGLGFYLQSTFILMTVLFGLGVQATFFGPLKYAILPDHLQENELIAGNSFIEAGTFLAILIGTILGGILILNSHGKLIVSFIILGFAIIGWLTSWEIPKTSNYNRSIKINYNIFKETYQLIKYTQDKRDIFLSILGVSWFWLVGAAFLSELPVFGKDSLHADGNVVTFFLTLFSVGLGLGSLLCNKLLKGKVHATYVPLGALGMSIFMIDLYFAASQVHFVSSAHLLSLYQFLQNAIAWRISFDLLMIAILGGIYVVPLYAIMQQRSEESHRARVISSNNVLNALFMVFAALIIVLMLKLHFTVNQVFLAVGLGNAVVAIYISKLLPEVFIKTFFRTVFSLFYRVKIKGLENYQAAGERVVIVANHTSFIDAALLASFLPEKLTFAVNSHVAKKWWIRFFLKLVDAFPLDPTNPMAIKSLVEFVQGDKKCVIFPEGRLTMTGSLMKIYEGPGLVADKAKAKLLPIRIDGAQFTPFSRLKGKVRIRWFPKISITIFPAQQLEVAEEIKGRHRRQIIGYKLYDLMTDVMFESSDYQKTFFSSLIDARTTHGRHHEILEDIERIPLNYQQFILRCFILGRKISQLTKAGEYVGILLPNMISNAMTFFAMQAYCRIPTLLNYSAGTYQILAACDTAKIKTIFTSQKFIRFAKLSSLIDELKNKGINIVYLENIHSSIRWIDKLRGMVFAKFPSLAYKWINSSHKHLIDENAPAVVLFTSGSEGKPKGVVLSHKNIQSNRFQLGACVDFNASDKVFNALPLFHSFGLMGGLLLPLLSGVRTFLYPSPLHYRIVPELTYDTNASILFGTDTFLSNYAKHAHPYDFYSIRYVFAGAEKLRSETHDLWSNKFGVRIFEGYGATETSPILSTNTPMQNKVGSVGRFLPGLQYRLEEIPGIEKGGVLYVHGPNIMKGYLLADNPGVLVPPQEGWYNTGDIVEVDEAGFITIKGRAKRFAKIGGEMVSLTMVEQQINLLWPGYQHAVINIADPKRGEQLILMTTYPEAKREEILSFAKSVGMTELSIPKKITIIEKMPLLGSGKIDYKELLNLQ